MAALLTIEEACARAYRCSSSIYPWTDLGRSTSLRACQEAEAEARVIVEKQLGKEAAKEACP